MTEQRVDLYFFDSVARVRKVDEYIARLDQVIERNNNRKETKPHKETKTK